MTVLWHVSATVTCSWCKGHNVRIFFLILISKLCTISINYLSFEVERCLHQPRKHVCIQQHNYSVTYVDIAHMLLAKCPPFCARLSASSAGAL